MAGGGRRYFSSKAKHKYGADAGTAAAYLFNRRNGGHEVERGATCGVRQPPPATGAPRRICPDCNEVAAVTTQGGDAEEQSDEGRRAQTRRGGAGGDGGVTRSKATRGHRRPRK